MKDLQSFKNSTVDKLLDLDKSSSGSLGVNRKFLGRRICDNKKGVVKFPIHRYSFDCINEVLVSDLANLLGIKCCIATKEIYQGNSSCIMSPFYNDGLFISAKQLVGTESFKEFNKLFNYKFILESFDENTLDDFYKMLFLDVITRQEDRHISNFGFTSTEMYPLFDNGRCLFYDSPDEEIPKTLTEIMNSLVTNEHGYGYYSLDLLSNSKRSNLVNKISKDDVLNIVSNCYTDEDRVNLISNYIYALYKLILS